MTDIGVHDVALRVAQALERAGIVYALGGSVATSLQGEPAELGPDFSVDDQALLEAVRRGRTADAGGQLAEKAGLVPQGQ